MARLSHIDAEGKAAMVDVSAKGVTARTATAKGSVYMAAETLRLVMEGEVKKGDSHTASQPSAAIWSSLRVMPGKSPTPSPVSS